MYEAPSNFLKNQGYRDIKQTASVLRKMSQKTGLAFGNMKRLQTHQIDAFLAAYLRSFLGEFRSRTKSFNSVWLNGSGTDSRLATSEKDSDLKIISLLQPSCYP